MHIILKDARAAWKQHRRIFRDPWRRWNDGAGVRVAVVDTGIDPDRVTAYTARRIVMQRKFVMCPETDPYYAKDSLEDMHGTICASVIAAMAKRCELIDCNVAEPRTISPTALASAISWAATSAKAHVISISVGTRKLEAASMVREACQQAMAQGSVVVAACPNWGSASLPSLLSCVLSIEGLDLGDEGRWCTSLSPPNRLFFHTGPYNVALRGVVAPARGNSVAAAAASAQIARLRSTFDVGPEGIYELMRENGIGDV